MRSSLITILEPLIGSTLTINHRSGTVVDILEDPPALVLISTDAKEEIRLDHLGRPQETGIPSWTISLFSETGNVLHPDLQRQINPELAYTANAMLNQKD
jgi:hypothetical protein